MSYNIIYLIGHLQVHEGRNHEVRELMKSAGLQVRLVDGGTNSFLQMRKNMAWSVDQAHLDC